MMRQELLQLANKVMSQKGWEPKQLENKFRSPGILRTLQSGKFGPSFVTAERFKAWLEDQLKKEVA